MAKPINLIAACSENRIIGQNGHLPWDIPEDTRHFLDTTRGRVLLMGRRSYEGYSGPRHDRTLIVLTRAKTLPGSPRTAHSLDEALAQAEDLPGEIFICGGERLYRETLPLARRLYLTLIHQKVEGDTRFPDWEPYFSRVVWKREGGPSPHPCSFMLLER